MWFRTLFHVLKGSSSLRRVAPQNSARRLALEGLEDRAVPATLALANAASPEESTVERTNVVAPQPAIKAAVGQNASGWTADSEGDFLPGYTGPQDPGLDVIAHRAMLTHQRVIFTGKMARDIAATQAIGGLYIIGVDRGQGTPRFSGRTPEIGPNVLWDSVVRINPDGTGLFNNIIDGVATPLDPADITIDGNQFTVSVPLSVMLPAATQPPEEWTYNLWPRNSAVIGNNAAVPDLAPDDGNSPVQVVPPAASQVAAGATLFDLALADPATIGGFDVDFDLDLLPAFNGLDVAVEQFDSTDPIVPPNPVRVAPVFVLNYGDSEDTDVPDGLNVSLSHYPTDPSLTLSPIFFGLGDPRPPGDEQHI